MNSSQNINPEANGYHPPHYGHRNHIAYSTTLDYIKQPRVNLTCRWSFGSDKRGFKVNFHPHLDPLPSREREGGGEGGVLWLRNFILW